METEMIKRLLSRGISIVRVSQLSGLSTIAIQHRIHPGKYVMKGNKEYKRHLYHVKVGRIFPNCEKCSNSTDV
jgi:hypothetical protein